MPTSVLVNSRLRYPDPEASYSPSERYPEYPFPAIAERPNDVYAHLRRTLLQLELDKARIGTPEWNPLGDFISRGSSVFVLCNFVYHRRARESAAKFAAKCIHGSVLRALCDYVLIAVGPEGRVQFGNAPLQYCRWERVFEETGASHVAEFYRRERAPVTPKDLRLLSADRSALGRVHEVQTGDDRDAVEVSLGSESLLAPIAGDGNHRARFRIADYKPERIEAFHAGSRHRYVIHRDVLESDVVISLSKLKTHEKVGITCGLKGLVGMVGHKDCLAHHRFGSPSIGGDEYPVSQRFLHPVSRFQDWVNGRDLDAPFQGLVQILDRNTRRVLRRLGANMGGAWYGNDTAWRMALDLGRIGHYARADGTMSDRPQRRHLSLIDGIIAGEGDGPLDAEPVELGALLFSDNVACGDLVACRIMGFDPNEIPLIREAFRPMLHPLVSPGQATRCNVILNGQNLISDSVAPAGSRALRPPVGWRLRLSRP